MLQTSLSKKIILVTLSFTYLIRATPTTHKVNSLSRNESESNETQESFSSSSSGDEISSDVSRDRSNASISYSDESGSYESVERKAPVVGREIGSAISVALEKADKYSKDLETVIKKADTQVSQWTRRIESIKRHIPGIGYGTSIITAYYTVWPLLRTFGIGLKKLIIYSRSVARWVVRKSAGTKSANKKLNMYSKTTQRRYLRTGGRVSPQKRPRKSR